MITQFEDGKLVFLLDEVLDTAVARHVVEAALAFGRPTVVIDLRRVTEIDSFALFDLVVGLDAIACHLEFRGARGQRREAFDHLKLRVEPLAST